MSDIHGNGDALDAVLAQREAAACREIWFLGDLGGYGPETERCYRKLLSRQALIIPGNHDLYYGRRMSGEFFSSEAMLALIVSGQDLSTDYRELMKHLPDTAVRKGFTLVHGSLLNPASDYIHTLDDARKNFARLKGRYALFGHTHRPGAFISHKGEISWITPGDGEVLSLRGKKALINPGSVGQPRDGDPRASWAVLDAAKKEVQYFRTTYDIQSYQGKMVGMGASEFLIARVEKGI